MRTEAPIMIPLLLLVICLSLPLHVKGSEQTISTHGNSLSLRSRRLHQNRNFECDLGRDQIREFLDEDSRTWRLDDDAIDDIDRNLQDIVNCSEEGDVILLDVTEGIRLANRVTFPWRLTISGSTVRSNRRRIVFPASDQKAVITCPSQDEGAFFIQASDVTLANLVFEDCELNPGDTSNGIVEIDACPDGGGRGVVSLQHVEFNRNELNGTVAFLMNEESCSDVEMNDVQFSSNICNGTCGARLSSSNELKDVHIEENSQTADFNGLPAVLYLPPESVTTIKNLEAMENQGTVIYSDGGNLTLTNGTFKTNEESVTRDADVFSACIHLQSSTATIERSSFVENRGISGAAVYASRTALSLTNTVVNQTVGESNGGGVYLFECLDVSVTDCSFNDNTVRARNGAAILSNNSESLVITRSTFRRNVAAIGGAVHVIGGSFAIVSSLFDENDAINSAGAVYVTGATVEATFTSLHTTFRNNSAENFAGALQIFTVSEAIIVNMTCTANAANTGGCLRTKKTPLTLNSSLIQANTAEFGGGISANESEVVIGDCLVTENSADFGGGLDLRVETSVLMDTVFTLNKAGTSGAGAFIIFGSSILDNCTFLENQADGVGGGMTTHTQSALTVSNSMFISNIANVTGGGVNVFAGKRRIFSGCSFRSNQAREQYGGGLHIEQANAFVEDSDFTQNTAFWGGGAFAESMSTGVFTNVSFSNNRAASLGAGFALRNATGLVRNTIFRGNTAPYGAGLYAGVQSAVVCEEIIAIVNTAEKRGGFAELSGNAQLNVTDSFVSGNIVTDGIAGAFYLTESRLQIDNTTVSDCASSSHGAGIAAYADSVALITNSFLRSNTARELGGSFALSRSTLTMINTQVSSSTSGTQGGGLYFEDSFAVIISCNISGNVANGFGGGVHMIRTTFRISNSTIERSIATQNSGGMYVGENSVVEMEDVRFLHNLAPFGAGVLISENCTVSMRRPFAFNNSATTSGGLVFIESSSNLNVTDGEFDSNEAAFGGDFVVLRNSRFFIKDSRSMNAFATISGGSIVVGSDSFIVMENVTINTAIAQIGAAIALQKAYLWGQNLQISNCKASIDGGGIHANDTSSVLCTGCIIEDNSAVDKGGGVFIEAHKTQLLAFQFDNCSFSGNRAGLGGGLHFVSNDLSVDCAEDQANCTFVALRSTTFTDNRALSAGGAILTSDLNAIRISCVYKPQNDPFQYLNRTQFQDLNILNTLENVCPRWSDNIGDVYGDDLASYARRVNVEILFEETGDREAISGNRYVVQNHRSGTQIPSVFLTVVDELNQGPASGPGNESIVATMSSPDRLFTGVISITLHGSVGNFSGVAGYREAGSYVVRIDYSEPSIQPFIIDVEVRGCMIGEVSAVQGTICQTCSGETYNFSPNRKSASCTACPIDASCDTHVIRPHSGHWHSSPCSKHVQECLTRKACDRPRRDDLLRQMGSQVLNCNLTAQFLRDYAEAECKEGYEGPLCGSCQKSYGRSRSFRCEKCFSGFGNFVVILLSIVMLLILSGFAIRSSLPSRNKSVREAGRRQRRQQGDATPTVAPDSPPVNMEMVQMMHSGFVPPEMLQQAIVQSTPSQQTMQKNAEIAKWKSVEIFKITINYLQVIAVAISINVNWTEALVTVFNTAEFIGGVTSEAATRSVDCMISSDSSIPRSAVRTVINVMVPMLVTALYFIFWAIAMIRLEQMVDYLLKRCILSFMAVSYLSYIAITKTAVNVLYCIDVFDQTEVDSDDQTSYWAVDTELKCYEGSHTILASLIGWPVLILFSFAFPVTIAYVLLIERKKHDMTSEWLYESTGFMYRAYAKEYVYWECIVMLRKAVLAVVVVFSYPLGGNLQGVLGVCVLMVALYLHIICSPFREEFDDLNTYEGLSLLISSITFVSGLFFNDERTSDAARILLSLLLIFANFGLILFLVVVFLKSGTDYLRTLLDADGIPYSADGGYIHVLRIYVRTRVKAYRQYALRRHGAQGFAIPHTV